MMSKRDGHKYIEPFALEMLVKNLKMNVCGWDGWVLNVVKIVANPSQSVWVMIVEAMDICYCNCSSLYYLFCQLIFYLHL